MLKRAGLSLAVAFGVIALSSTAFACDWRVGGCSPYRYYAAPFIRYRAAPFGYYAPPSVYAVAPRFSYYAAAPNYGYASPGAYGYAYYPSYYYPPRIFSRRFSPN
jgi:hypothetical protein